MRVNIKHGCSYKYRTLLRFYCGMSAFTALCASIALGIWNLDVLSFAAAGLCGFMCCAAVVIPLYFGKICYIRHGQYIKIEKGVLTRRTQIIRRNDIRASEIKRSFPERRLGLCTLTFFTGGGKVRLRGIELADGRLLDRMMSPETI